MKKILIGTLIVTTMATCFLAGVAVEQKQSARREAFIMEAIEDGDKLVWCKDGGIIRVRHDK